MKLTKKQLHIIQHSLGCDQYGMSDSRGRDEHDGCLGFYRNRYVCGPRPEILELVTAGLMVDHGPQSIAGGMHCYSVTPAGVLAMDEQSPSPPRVSAAKRRWRAFSGVSERYEDFAGYLGFDSPKYYLKVYSFSKPEEYQMRSSRASGEWCATKKAAKASYKAALAQSRKWRCRETLCGID